MNLLLSITTALATALATIAPAQAQERAHVHGAVQLQLVVEPDGLTLTLEAPQDNLVGHERVPRSAAEKQAAEQAIKRLEAGAALWPLPAALQCKLAKAQVDAPRLTGMVAGDGHADVDASWRFDCARTDSLRSLDLGPLLDAFTRIQQVRLQVVTGTSQHQAALRRPARTLAWRK